MESLHGINCPCHSYKLGQDDDNINYTIELSSLKCLNEKETDSCKTVFREENKKYDFDPNTDICSSFDQDPELVFAIRFNEEIQLRAINFISGPAMLPSELNL